MHNLTPTSSKQPADYKGRLKIVFFAYTGHGCVAGPLSQTHAVMDDDQASLYNIE